MDEGPFRAPRSTDRRGIRKPPESAPAPTYRQPEESQSVIEEPEAVRPSVPVESQLQSRRQPVVESEEKANRKRPRFLLSIIIIVIVIILGVIGWFMLSRPQSQNTAIDASKYQAVFFTNQQVYFGKLKMLNNDYMELDNVYYLQTQSSTGTDTGSQSSTSDQTSVLVRLDSAIHGPEDTMIIAKDQVLYYENLKPTGKVAQLIATAQKS